MSGTTARVVAQAKINLFLRVLARDASGYHQLETLFCRLELGDLVTVRVTSGPSSLDCAGPMLPAAGLGPVEQNLAWRAAAAFRAEANWPGGVAIEIDKRVPVGGGLGGGSADAGAVLRALNTLAPHPLPAARVQAIAAGLGADVPFVASEHALAFGWGYGEQLEPLSALPPRECWLFCLHEGVRTADAYRWLDDSRAGRPERHRSRADSLGVRLWTQVAQLASNDFEAVVSPRVPRVGEVLQLFRELAGRAPGGDSTIALLCGSGSTVACLPETAIRGDAPVATRAGERVVRTRTALRVAPVEWLE